MSLPALLKTLVSLCGSSLPLQYSPPFHVCYLLPLCTNSTDVQFGPRIRCSDVWRSAVLDGPPGKGEKRSEVRFSCVHKSTQVRWFAPNLLPFSQLFLRVRFVFLFCTICVGRFLICEKIWHQLTFSLSLASLQRDAELIQGLRINHKYKVVCSLSCTGGRTVSWEIAVFRCVRSENWN